MNVETIKMTPREEIKYYKTLLNGKNREQAYKIMDDKNISYNTEKSEDEDYIDFETKGFTLSYYTDDNKIGEGIQQVWVGEDTYQDTLEGLEKEIKDKNIDTSKPNE